MAVAATTSAEPILRLRGVGRRFGGLHAVRDVDLDVAHGERRAILGPNGAGKTTLFNVISGDVPADVRDDRVPRPATRRMLPARRRAEARACRAPTRSRGSSSASRSRTTSTSRSSGVDARPPAPGRAPRRDGAIREERAGARRARRARRASSRRSSRALSHGEQRQLEVGMARAGEPKLMMLDEPASGLSRGERVALTELLLDARPHDVTLILIEHDMDVALAGRRLRDDDARRPQDRRRARRTRSARTRWCTTSTSGERHRASDA